jgi:hypothetical protein
LLISSFILTNTNENDLNVNEYLQKKEIKKKYEIRFMSVQRNKESKTTTGEYLTIQKVEIKK